MWNHDLGHSQRILAFKYVSVGTNSSLIIDISVVLKIYIYVNVLLLEFISVTLSFTASENPLRVVLRVSHNHYSSSEVIVLTIEVMVSNVCYQIIIDL
jgi:hypothetical protein